MSWISRLRRLRWSFFRRSPVAEDIAPPVNYWYDPPRIAHTPVCPCGCNRQAEDFIASQVRAAALLDRWRPERVAPTDTDPPNVRQWKEAREVMAVVGSSGGTYFIDDCSEVYSADSYGAMHHWCLLIRDSTMPISDRVLVKMLLIQADEDLFTRTAKGGPPRHGRFTEANIEGRVITADYGAVPYP